MQRNPNLIILLEVIEKLQYYLSLEQFDGIKLKKKISKI